MFRDGVTVMTVDYYCIWMKLLYVIQFGCICRICFETKMSIFFLLHSVDVYHEECLLQIFKHVLTAKEMGFIALS